MHNKLEVVIIGGGLSGLTAAIAFRRAGHTVTILEQSSMKKELGAALALSPNATRVLLSLELDLQKARTVPWEKRLTFMADSDTTKVVEVLNMKAVIDAYGSPCVTSHRADLHDALKELAIGKDGPGVPTELISGKKVVSVNTSGASIVCEDGEVYSADLIIGADGVHSRTRRFVIGYEDLPRPSTTTVMRFTVASDIIRDHPVLAPLLEGGDNVLRCYLVPDDENRYILQYACRDNTLQNFVMYDLNDTQSLPPEKWNMLTTRDYLTHRLRGFNKTLSALSEVAGEVLPLWKCLDRDPIPRLFQDRLVLIGDAAHPMYPHLGQGAAMGIEDAGCLGILFEHCDASQIAKRLKLFQFLRHNRVSAAQIMSRVKTTADTLAEVEELYSGYFESAALPRNKLETANWLFKYDFAQEAAEALRGLQKKP